MDTALLHAGATAATGGAGVAFSPVPHISINYEFIFLISECWCPHDKLIVSPDPGPSIPEHMPHHSSTSPHLCPVADTRCRLLTCSPPASKVTQGRSCLIGTLWGSPVLAFNFLILLLWRLTSKPKPLLPASVDEETLRLCGG